MKIIVTALFTICSFLTNAQFVIDKGNFLSKKEIESLNNELQSYFSKNNIEVQIYTTANCNGQNPKDYALDYFNIKRIGKSGINNGILIFLSREERHFQILNGFGIEWLISDKDSRIIVDSVLIHLKKKDFSHGIHIGITLIEDKLNNIKWNILEKPLIEVNKADEGEIIKFTITSFDSLSLLPIINNKEQQFDENYKIRVLDSPKAYILYTSNMNDLIRQIRFRKYRTVYARLTNWETKTFQLLGVEK